MYIVVEKHKGAEGVFMILWTHDRAYAERVADAHTYGSQIGQVRSCVPYDGSFAIVHEGKRVTI